MKILALAFLTALLSLPASGRAHCDALDGPIAREAAVALVKGKADALLKWVRAQDEGEVKAAFEKALKVRKKGAEAAELAERWFLETLVRLHRASEGAAYSGLKPAGSTEPLLRRADEALDSGSAEGLAKQLTEEITQQVNLRFEKLKAAKGEAEKDPEAGRKYVGEYLAFMEYLEAILATASGKQEKGAQAETQKE